MPGNLLLGGKYVNSQEMITFAEELLDSCYQTWKHSPTGLSPEAWGWIDDPHYNMSNNIMYTSEQAKLFDQLGFIPNDLRYMLRPGKKFRQVVFATTHITCFFFFFVETIESLFYFYRLTGETKYQVRCNS